MSSFSSDLTSKTDFKALNPKVSLLNTKLKDFLKMKDEDINKIRYKVKYEKPAVKLIQAVIKRRQVQPLYNRLVEASLDTNQEDEIKLKSNLKNKKEDMNTYKIADLKDLAKLIKKEFKLKEPISKLNKKQLIEYISSRAPEGTLEGLKVKITKKPLSYEARRAKQLGAMEGPILKPYTRKSALMKPNKQLEMAVKKEERKKLREAKKAQMKAEKEAMKEAKKAERMAQKEQKNLPVYGPKTKPYARASFYTKPNKQLELAVKREQRRVAKMAKKQGLPLLITNN